MSDAILRIDHFTDPACPWAFSAEPDLLALDQLYGDQLEWHTRLVVLSERPGDSEAKGMTLELLMMGDERLGSLYGMPINAARRPHMLVAKPVDMLVKAAQLAEPEKADAVLRALRVAWQTDHRPVDDPEVGLSVAAEAGADRAKLSAQLELSETAEALAEDMRAARTPLPAAAGPLDHKLGGPPEERRYTCPSLVVTRLDGTAEPLAAPGFQSLGAYEVVLANLAPELTRKAPPTDPLEVLQRAGWPLATVEVARVMGVDSEEAAGVLSSSSAVQDDRGYWSAA